jgi:DNA-binding transcriptional regulator GbsR (MarR family)
VGYIVSLLSGSGFILYNRALAQKLGVNAAIVMGYLCRLAEAYGSGFYYRQEQIADDIALSVYEVRGAVKKLMDAGLVNMVLEGIPARNKYTVLEDALEMFIKSTLSCEKSSQQAAENLDTKTSSDKASNTKREENRRKKDDSKRVYGTLSNVLLTDTEYTQLQERFPKDYQDRIDDLSVWLPNGKPKKNHYATILNWDRLDKKRKAAVAAPAPKKPVPYDYD